MTPYQLTITSVDDLKSSIPFYSTEELEEALRIIEANPTGKTTKLIMLRSAIRRRKKTS